MTKKEDLHIRDIIARQYDRVVSISAEQCYDANGELQWCEERPITNLYISSSPVKKSNGTVVSIHGHMENLELVSTNMRDLAHAAGLDYIGLESHKHSITAKQNLDDNYHYDPMRNMEELELSIYHGLEKMKQEDGVNLDRCVLVSHSMAVRAAVNNMVKHKNIADMFAEYVFTEPYILTAASLANMRQSLPEKFSRIKMCRKKNSHTVMGQEIGFATYAENLIMRSALPDYKGKKTIDESVYEDEYMAAVFENLNFAKKIGDKKTHFVFAEKSEATDLKQLEKVFKYFDAPNKYQYIIKEADHNFNTRQLNKGSQIPDTAPTEYRNVIQGIFNDFASNGK